MSLPPINSIVQGDCLDTMRQWDAGTIDAIITDPPYSSGAFTEVGRKSANSQGMNETADRLGWFGSDNMGTAGMVWLLRSVASEAARLLKDGGSLCIFTDWRQVVNLAPGLESTGLRFNSLVVWDKGSPGMGNGFKPQHELILHYAKGTPSFHAFDGSNVIGVRRVPPPSREHPTQKPEEIMAELIRVVCPPGGLVLDPFAGSGTTLVAAERRGYKWIGIEREPHFAEVARKRTAQQGLALQAT